MLLVAQIAEVQWKDSSATFDESAGTVQVTLVRSGNLTSLATVFYRTVEGTATSSFDFQSISNRQALFTSGKEELTINTTITQDFLEEGPETFLLQLFNPNTGTILGINKDLSITIQDDDVPMVQWAEGIVHVGEDATSVSLTALRSGGTGSSISVNYETTGGTATPFQDFQSKIGTIIFPAGVTQQIVQVNINNDSFIESDEEFTVALSNLSSGEIGPQNPVRVIIEDDDSSPGIIGWNVSAVQEVEGNTQIQIIAQRTGGTMGSVSVNYATFSGTATGEIDFEGASGFFSWATGSNTPRAVTINILDDQLDEANETFEVVLSNLIGNDALGQSTTTITILDNDDASSPGQIGFTNENMIVEESIGTISVGVTRTGGSSGELAVGYSFVDSTANNNEDFDGVGGSLLWTDGDVEEKFIQIPITNDGSNETDESFFVTLSADDIAVLSDANTLTVLIEDDDINSPGTIVFANSTQSISEGSGSVSVFVQRIGGATGAVSARYETEDGIALASVDFTSQVGVLNWADGDNFDKVIVVNLIDDQFFEGNESFSLRLDNTPGGLVVGANTVHSVTIQDDETQPSTWFEFTRILYSGTEGAGVIVVQIERFGDGVGAASVRIQSNNADAIAGVDYVSLNSDVNWLDGDLEPKFVSITVMDDAIIEVDERVTLVLTEPSGNALIGDVSEAQALIYDDDGDTGELVNLSTRGYVGTGDEVLIGGFIIFNGPQRMLIRAVGPSLAGVEGVVSDPFLQIINNADQSLVVENDNWTDDASQIQLIIDTGLGGLNLFESALLITLQAGSYSAIVSPNGSPGIGSIEIFVDAGAGLSGDLVNISTRGRVSSGSQTMIGGLIIGGNQAKRLLFRGMGPSLIVPGSPSLTNPELLLFNDAGQIIQSNDNWLDASNWDEIEATQLIPMNSEAAMLLDLSPGAYTIHLRSAQDETGIGSVEIYSLN